MSPPRRRGRREGLWARAEGGAPTDGRGGAHRRAAALAVIGRLLAFAGMTTYVHAPHPRTTERPPAPPQAAHEYVGFNGRLGAAITRGVGTMWAFYIAAGLHGRCG